MQIKAVRAIGTQMLSLCGKIINFSLVNIPVLGDIFSDVSKEVLNGLISEYKYRNDLKEVLQNVYNLSQDENIGDKLKIILMELVAPQEVELTKKQIKKFEKQFSKSLCSYAVSRKLSDQKVDEYIANSTTFNNLSDDEKGYIVNAIEALIQIYIKEKFDELNAEEQVLAASINESFAHGIKNLESILMDILNQIKADVKETKAYVKEIKSDGKETKAKIDAIEIATKTILAKMDGNREDKEDDEKEFIDFEEVETGNIDLGNLFKQAIEGNAEAELILAQCYLKGVLVTKSESDAIKYYKKSALHGNIKAQYNLGLCAEYGISLKKDETEAFGYYKSAAEAGNGKAQFKLADCYFFGAGVKRDVSKAEKWYEKAAQQGNVKAQAALGIIYFAGKDKKNDKKMIQLLSVAAEKGETLALFILARCYESGRGVKQNVLMSYKLYLRAANAGDDDAQFLVGLYHFSGVAGVQDFEQAFKWFENSAQQGNGGSQAYAGLLYIRGMGIQADVEKGWELINKSVAQDNLYGNGIMAICKAQGLGCKPDPDAAFYFAQRAARQGNIEALYYLGLFYVRGIGCGTDVKKGIGYIIEAALSNNVPAIMELEQIYNMEDCSPRLKKYIEVNYFNQRKDGEAVSLKEKTERTIIKMTKEKAESGDALMQYQYALLLINGMGVEQDTVKGIEMLKAAKMQDCLPAYAQLAACYFNGIGVEKNEEEALVLAEYAANKGDETAKTVLTQLLENLNRTLDDESKSKNAFEKLLKLAQKGNKQAQRSVGLCYKNGRGIDESKEEAFKWFLRAAKQDDGSAQYFLADCYERGEGTRKDSIKAVIWCAKAAEKGNEYANYMLGEMFSHGMPIAVNFYLNAAINGDSMAKYKLGYCLEFGKGIKVDLNEALKWYNEAAADNVRGAQEAIARVEEKLKK